MNEKQNISDLIKEKSRELGFLECRIIPSGKLTEEEDHLRNWLNQGMNGEMDYLARNVEKRLDPALLVDRAKTIVLVLQNYFTPVLQADPRAPIISRYAYGKTYQDVIKKKLQRILKLIQENIPGCSGRIFTDSAPVLEKAWARHAGMGWIGKNSLLVSPDHGTFFFIGEIILDTELEYDETPVQSDRCGTCTLCMDACPTGAIMDSRVIDARRCIAYHTIETREEPDEKLKGKFRNRIFGCDICQEACPWNRKALPHREPEFTPSSALLSLTASEWAQMDEERFKRLFQNSPLKRAGYEKIKKNIEFIKSAES